MFPDAAAANHAIFYRAGRAASVGEVYAGLTHAAGGGSATIPAPATQGDQFLQYASARRLDRMEQERELVDMVLRGPQQPDRGGGRALAGSMFSADMLRVLSEARHERGRSG